MSLSNWLSFDTKTAYSKEYAQTHRKMSVSLRRLFPGASFVGCADIKVTGSTSHSGKCKQGDLFAALPGYQVNGIDYVQEAVQKGAISLLVQKPLPGVNLQQCIVKDVRSAYAELCAELHGRPARTMSVTGVTGTNGKTTVTWLLRSILETADRKTGLLGTIQYSDGTRIKKSKLTTPGTDEFASWLTSMTKTGVTSAAVELSSHALDQKRVSSGTLDVAIVTNVTQDHFDYHGDKNHYLKSKASILRCCKPGAQFILNQDDPGCREIYQQISHYPEILTFGIENQADVSATIREESLSETRFELNLFGEKTEVCLHLIGKHNVQNAMAAATAAYTLGVPISVIKAGLENVKEVPGRMQHIPTGQGFDLFVDYAHTSDALHRSLSFLKPLVKGKLICLFGAGGDRDRTKRPLMGKTSTLADLSVITSDNPRSEDPQKIIEDILSGIEGKTPYVESDREKAIAWTIHHAKPGDCILIAGKGHEQYQEIQGEKKTFCDVFMARKYLKLEETDTIPVTKHHQHAA